MDNLKKNSSTLLIESTNGKKIKCILNGKKDKAIILSNMDTNEIDSWNPIIEKLITLGYMALSYQYNNAENNCIYDLHDVLKFVENMNLKNYILIGASRGGVISLKSAINSKFKDSIAAVIAISAPQNYEGEDFYSDEELKQINTPVLLINSEFDDAVLDTKKMYELFEGKKELLICSGNNHGTDIFYDNKDILIEKICSFVTNI